MIKKTLSYLNKGNRRSARAKKNIAAMFALKGVSILCQLAVVPMTINYVSKYEYGIWITISSLVAWLSFFDLGIGNGLRNKMIEAIETGKHRLAKVYVSTSYAIISIIVACVWAVSVSASFFIDWCEVLNARAGLRQELVWTVVIVVTNFSLLFVLGLNRTLLNAVQKPAVASVFDTMTQLLLCVVLLVLINTTSGSLINLALAMGGTSMLVLVASNIWTFTGVLKRYRPSVWSVRFRLGRRIMSTGLAFFLLQIIAIAFYETNNLIITHFIGPDEVTVYNVAYKYMQVLMMVFTILIAPFWSAFAEANINGDFVWMRSTVKTLVRFVAVLGLLGLAMVAVSPLFYRVWLQGQVEVPILITLLVFLFHIANIWSTLWTQLLCGFGKIRLQMLMSTLCCLFYLPAAIFGCRYFGLAGLLCASVLSFAVFTSWFGVMQVHKLINRTAKGIWNK